MLVAELIIALASLISAIITGTIALVQLFLMFVMLALEIGFTAALHALPEEKRKRKQQQNAQKASQTSQTASPTTHASPGTSPPHGTSVWQALLTLQANKWFRRFRIALVALTLITFATLLIANFFFFPQIARYALNKVQAQTAITITYATIQGNLFTGKLSATDITLSRTGHPTTDFDLQAQSLDIDLDVFSLPFPQKRVQHAELINPTGRLTRKQSSPPSLGRKNANVTINHLQITNANLRYQDLTRPKPLTVDLLIDRWISKPMRSRSAAFDFLFRTNALGSVNGHDFKISSNRVGQRVSTTWEIPNIEANLFGLYTGGLFKWIHSGSVGIKASTSWRDDQHLDINLDWSLIFSNIEADIPPSVTGFTRTLAENGLDHIKQNDPFNLGFAITLDRHITTGSMSTDLKDLTSRIIDAAIKELALKSTSLKNNAPALRNKAKATTRSLLGKIKDKLNKAEDEQPPAPKPTE